MPPKLKHMAAYNTFSSKDMEAERELAKFLDKYLYTKDTFTKAERTDNATTQIVGSDFILSIPSILLNKEEYIRLGEFYYFV